MKSKPIILLVGGMSALIVAMGIGRFAFTPILPMMLDRHLFTTVGAGYLASSNYLGYLIGALCLTIFPLKRRDWLLTTGLLVSIATTWGMGAFQSFEVWFLLRFLSGVASAIVFVVTSSIVLEYLSAIQAGIYYGGVGLGIFLTGVAVPLLTSYNEWMGAWKGLGLFSLILGLLASYSLRVRRQDGIKTQSNLQKYTPSSAKRILICLMIAYGLEGLGYIVTGTYLVAFAKASADHGWLASSSWIVVGIAAAPSCVVWSMLAARWGKKRALTFAMLLQSMGIAIPVVFPSSATLLVGAILFGATFMGITTIALSFAKDLYPQDNRKLIGLLTTLYGVGQMIGPVIAGTLIAIDNSYETALYGAALIVLMGAFVLLMGIGPAHQIQSIEHGKGGSIYAIRKH